MLRRREFIQRASAVTATGILGLSASGCDTNKKDDTVTFDLHCHPGVFPTKGTARFGTDGDVIKTVHEMNSSGLSGAFFSLVADMPLIKITEKGVIYDRVYEKGEAWSEYKRQMAVFKELFKAAFTVFVCAIIQLRNKKSRK